MARKFLNGIDLTQLQILNAAIQVLASAPGSPVTGQMYFNSVTTTFQVYTGSAWIVLGTLDQIAAAAGNVALGTNRITGLGDPSAAQDAATKNYVDNAVNGLSWKDPVRLASTGNVVVASGLVNGATIDGQTVATGDRVLLRAQTAPAENGIYVAVASGAASRSADATTAAQLVNLAVGVEEGTAYAATFWVLTTNPPLVVGTTALTFAQWGAGAAYSAGTGLSLAANVFSIENSGILLPAHGGTGVASPTAHAVVVGEGASPAASVGPGTQYQTLNSGGAGADPVFDAVHLAQAAAVTGSLPVGNGGTGGTTAATARSGIGATTKYAASFGDGSTTSYVINHALGTTDVIVMVFRVASPYDVIDCDIQITDTNDVTLIFAVAPTSNQYRVVVIG